MKVPRKLIGLFAGLAATAYTALPSFAQTKQEPSKEVLKIENRIARNRLCKWRDFYSYMQERLKELNGQLRNCEEQKERFNTAKDQYHKRIPKPIISSGPTGISLTGYQDGVSVEVNRGNWTWNNNLILSFGVFHSDQGEKRTEEVLEDVVEHGNHTTISREITEKERENTSPVYTLGVGANLSKKLSLEGLFGIRRQDSIVRRKDIIEHRYNDGYSEVVLGRDETSGLLKNTNTELDLGLRVSYQFAKRWELKTQQLGEEISSGMKYIF